MINRIKGAGKTPKRYLIWLFVIIIQLALQSCASRQTMVFHSFDFDAAEDSPDAEIVDYQYGNSTQFGTFANKARVKRGEPFKQHGIAGVIPRGDFLYVKWLIKESGQVYEDKVDLSSRLPSDIKHHGIHFLVHGPQLYVYLIPPPGVWPASAIKRSVADEKVAAYLKQHQIYP